MPSVPVGAQNNASRPTNGQNTSVAAVPFAQSTWLHTEAGEQRTVTLGATTQNITLQVPVYGYLHTTYLAVDVSSTGNTADVALNADAPWNVLRSILFRDANNTPIISNLSGYDMYLANLLGGYRRYEDITDMPSYVTPTTGTGGTAGTFSFRIPLEHAFGRDYTGVLANMDASAQYGIDLVVADLASVYSTAPNGAVSFTVRVEIEALTRPFATDGSGATMATSPAAMGSVQYWAKSVFNLNGGGENTIQFTRVGNIIRNYIFVVRNTSQARADLVGATGNWILEFDNGIWYNESQRQRQDYIYKAFGDQYVPATNALGVTCYPFTLDPDGIPGMEFGDMYKKTEGSTRIVVRVTPSADGTLTVLTNDVILRGAAFVNGGNGNGTA